MKNKAKAFLAVALLAVTGYTAQAADVVGYNHIVVGANSDARITVPFSKFPQTVNNATVLSVAGKTGTGITVTGTPFTASQFAGGTYYVRFLSGSAEGLWSTVTANSTSELTLESSAVLAKVTGNETFSIFKHMTVNDVFPPANAGLTFAGGNLQSKLFIFNNNVGGLIQNPGSIASSNFFNGAWVGSANGNTIIKPETQVIFRNASPNSVELLITGRAPSYNPSFLISANGDVVVGTGLAVPTTLAASGFGGTNLRKAFFYSTTDGIPNAAAIGSSTYFNGSWVGAINGTRVINGSESVTLRLPAGEPGDRVIVQNPAPY